MLEYRETGVRRVAGTEHPVRDELVRDQRGDARATWQVVRGLCNGVPSRADEYTTEREARAAWATRWEATPREARKRKPIALTLSDAAQSALAGLAERGGKSRSEIVDTLVLSARDRSKA